MTKADELLIKYFKRFGTSYPLYHLAGQTTEEHIATIEECLRTGKPIKPEYIEGRDY